MNVERGNTIPYNAEAEKSVLYCLIADQEKAQRINEIDESDFYNPNYQAIYTAICKCTDVKSFVDPSSLSNYLNNTLMGVVVNDILDAQATSEVFSHYLKILKEYSKRRKLIKINSNIIKAAYNTEIPVDELILKAECDIAAIDSYAEDKFKTAYDVFGEFHEQLCIRLKNKGKLPGLSTGFTDIDDMTGGLTGGYLYVIAARPGKGKTALGINIAMHVSKQKNPIAVFSLEMSDSLLMQRMIAEETLVSNTHMKIGLLDDAELSRIVNSTPYTARKDFFMDDKAGVSADYITMRCRRINNILKKDNKKLELIVVDYLQIMGGKSRDQRLVVEENCRKLKNLSRDLKVPVILLSQLNRDNEKREDKRPILADLRESGAIEQDADLVAMIHTEENISEIIFCKQRDGAMGTIKLGWDGERTRFYNLKKVKEG